MAFVVLNTLFTVKIGPWFSTSYREMYLMQKGNSDPLWMWQVKEPYDTDRMLRVGKAMMHDYLKAQKETLVYGLALSSLGKTEIKWWTIEGDRDIEEQFHWDTKSHDPKLWGVERFEFLVPHDTTRRLTEARALSRMLDIAILKPEIQRFGPN